MDQLTFPKTNQQIILASSSKIRKELLQNIKIAFKAIPPIFDEEKAKIQLQKENISIKKQCLKLAEGKALSLSSKYPDSFIIGSDQMCCIEKKILSKPKNKKEAIHQLELLSNKYHQQINATAIAKNQKIIWHNCDMANIKVRNLNKKNIENYVKLDDPVGCCGAYKMESMGKLLFEEITGDWSCIMGMSMTPLINFLLKKNIISL